MVYEPKEDSYLLEKWVKQYSKGIVLDMGTGSGIQAIAASKTAEKVVAVDINPKVKLHEKNIEFRQGNLFELIKKDEKFDLIIFNPPYLPDSEYDKQPDTSGGPTGRETIIRFLQQAKNHLAEGGTILLLFSSLTGEQKLLQEITKLKYKPHLLEEKHISFEDIYVYELKLD